MTITTTTIQPGRDMETRATPFTSWEVPDGFATFDVVQRFNAPSVYRFGVAHVYDDGTNRIVVTPGNGRSYIAGGYFAQIETAAGKPGRWCPNVNEALAEARRMITEVTA